MKLKAIIADDEALAREGLRLLLAEDSDVDIVEECSNGRQTIAAIKEHQADVLFLDIQMPGKDGFEVIQQVCIARMPVVVFITAHNEYAVKAFEVEALDYLTKPAETERLQNTLRRDLIVAFLQGEDEDFWNHWNEVTELHKTDPLAELEAHLDWIAERVGRPNHRGCQQFNVTAEFPDLDHPAQSRLSSQAGTPTTPQGDRRTTTRQTFRRTGWTVVSAHQRSFREFAGFLLARQVRSYGPTHVL